MSEDDLNLYEALARLRDHHYAIGETLDKLVQTKTKTVTKEVHWDPSKIKWINADGTKGPYEKAEPEATENFKDMLADIKQHNGKLSRDGLFYWVFTDQATVGRKKRSY